MTACVTALGGKVWSVAPQDEAMFHGTFFVFNVPPGEQGSIAIFDFLDETSAQLAQRSQIQTAPDGASLLEGRRTIRITSSKGRAAAQRIADALVQ